jgi:hypothetical protein
VKKKSKQPSRSKTTILRQVVELIPTFLVSKLASQFGVDKRARDFTPWSHVVSMIYAQLSRAIGLNDVCDALGLHIAALFSMRAATPPRHNTLSHANTVRDCAMAESLFWKMLGHLGRISPMFVKGSGKGVSRKFRHAIHLVDSTTIQLVVSCMGWAAHRRRKAAAKCHMRLDLRGMLPNFAIVGTARQHDSTRAVELCAGLREGEIVIFDKAYVDFTHLHLLTERGVFFVTRAKDNMAAKVVKRRKKHKDTRIIADDEIVLTVPKSKQQYPQRLRRVTAIVQVNGKDREMVFLTNNFEWSPLTVADLYKARWQIEVFFKQLKQSVQLVDFLGNSANAVRWQIWTALLTHLLLRYLAWRSKWKRPFSRIANYIRAALWLRYDLQSLLKTCGIAPPPPQPAGDPGQLWLQGLAI